MKLTSWKTKNRGKVIYLFEGLGNNSHFRESDVPSILNRVDFKNYKYDQTLRLSNAEKFLDSCIDEQPTKNEGDLSEVRSVPNRK